MRRVSALSICSFCFLVYSEGFTGILSRDAVAQCRLPLFATRDQSSLTFRCDIQYTSEVLPECGKEEAAAFLFRPETRDLLLSAGGSRLVKEVLVTPEIKGMWVEACQRYYSQEDFPEKGDKVMVVGTEIKFPGLKLMIKALSGVKAYSTDDGLYIYKFYSIAEKQQVEGALPVVWLFNQITGAKDKPNGFGPSNAWSKTCVSIVELGAGTAYNFDCTFEIKMQFPATLLRLLPASKEMVEEQSSITIRNTLFKDIVKAVDASHKAFSQRCDSTLKV
ncbi:predicted protein [Phaeodactylum tricornutum CCAP 1055/1]|uniref:Uncharacterized protein n=2 Tax=Phaeodactylum tricornutum TaxID=2850 RepID=B7FT46_PHATC|nr:predicted protein [Phaeodactylum tricornutum CCAP 1055/1]EEC50589.1 predicted protein [Phaeodactylum tricornutum CCAP 1055/1]|eukprot:XP_002177775.1 predicted protein [Phaeodactylum tricornutum CCAP 1055/1]